MEKKALARYGAADVEGPASSYCPWHRPALSDHGLQLRPVDLELLHNMPVPINWGLIGVNWG